MKIQYQEITSEGLGGWCKIAAGLGVVLLCPTTHLLGLKKGPFIPIPKLKFPFWEKSCGGSETDCSYSSVHSYGFSSERNVGSLERAILPHYPISHA